MGRCRVWTNDRLSTTGQACVLFNNLPMGEYITQHLENPPAGTQIQISHPTPLKGLGGEIFGPWGPPAFRIFWGAHGGAGRAGESVLRDWVSGVGRKSI